MKLFIQIFLLVINLFIFTLVLKLSTRTNNNMDKVKYYFK